MDHGVTAITTERMIVMKKWILPILFAVIGSVISIIVFKDLPDRLAIHFNNVGNPDNWINKSIGAFLVPILLIVIPAFILVTSKLEKDENKRRKAKSVEAPLFAIIAIMLFVVHCFTIAYNLGYELQVTSFATVIAGMLFIVVGNFIPKMPPRKMKWPRIPEHNHRKAARFQGRFIFVCGIILLLLVLLPVEWIFPTFSIVLAIMLISLVISSLYFSRKA